MGGDQEAFASLAAGASTAATRLPTGSCAIPHRAEDAAQQALFGAWRTCRTLRDPERFDAWLHSSSSTPATRRHAASAAGPPGSGSFPPTTRSNPTWPAPSPTATSSSALPQADTGTAGGRRPASPPRVSAHGDRGDPGHPRRDRAVPPPLRGPSAAGRARSRPRVPRDVRGATGMSRSPRAPIRPAHRGLARGGPRPRAARARRPSWPRSPDPTAARLARAARFPTMNASPLRGGRRIVGGRSSAGRRFRQRIRQTVGAGADSSAAPRARVGVGIRSRDLHRRLRLGSCRALWVYRPTGRRTRRLRTGQTICGRHRRPRDVHQLASGLTGRLASSSDVSSPKESTVDARRPCDGRRARSGGRA